VCPRRTAAQREDRITHGVELVATQAKVTARRGDGLAAISERKRAGAGEDGVGANGFYALGALIKIEALFGKTLCETLNLVFGLSIGAIIAALIRLGWASQSRLFAV
jgi:hypothetical protein